MKKIFLLGVGCQKGGTTWLHNYLNNHPNVDLGFRKEYHLFDALYLPEHRGFYRKALDNLNELFNRKKNGLSLGKTEHALKHLDFYLDKENYFNYFDFLHYKNEKIRVVGEITPTYACLPVEAFELIKTSLEARGLKLKLFLLCAIPLIELSHKLVIALESPL